MLCGCLGNSRSRPLRGFGVINLSSLQEFIHKRTRLTVRLVRDSRGGPARSQEELTLKRERNTKMLAQATLQKLRNAESSLVFMREQHARTLEGLHEEIHKLQKKNASEFNLDLFCLAPP